MRFKERHEAVMARQADGGGNNDGGPSDQFSNQAESYSTSFDSYHNVIPEDSKGSPEYSGEQYAGTVSSVHPKNG